MGYRPRRKSSANEPLGLSKEELKQRRQSFKLDDRAMVRTLTGVLSDCY